MVSPELRGQRVGAPAGLLAADEPSPVAILNPTASSPFVLTGDHAGVAVPRSLDSLGLSDAERGRHIACDIGVRAVGLLLAEELDACFVHQHYSRLVIDCNRDPASADAIPEVSDGTTVPANVGLAATARAGRAAAIHAPYHAAIAQALDARGGDAILVALHSFTPVMAGVVRPWDIGILHDGGKTRFARAVLAHLVAQPAFVTGDNAPYRMDATDHSVPRHAYPRGIAYVEVEFRQDHLAAPGGAALWARRFAAALRVAAQGLRSTEGSPGSGSTP